MMKQISKLPSFATIRRQFPKQLILLWKRKRKKFPFKIIQLEIFKTYLSELNDHLKKQKGGKAAKERREEVIVIAFTKNKIDEEKNKTYNKIFPETKEKTKAALEKLEKKVEKEESALLKKEDLKSIALGTSKLNYNDPRISVAWCKKNEVPIEKVFTKTHREKFLWAMYAPMDFEF